MPSAAEFNSVLGLLPIFDALPGAFLLLSPEFIIEAATDEYLAVTLTTRPELLNRNIFDAFPDNPASPEAQSTHNLRASLARVLTTGQPHEMARQHYDVPDPARPGHFVERHWLPRNTPVLGEQAQVIHIIHAVVDVTAQVQADAQLRDSQAREQAARTETETQRQRLYHILEHFPAVVASYRGPEHVFELVSHRFQRDFPTRIIKGRPIREALPELAGQQYYEILDRVYETGEPFYGTELETWVDLTDTGQLELQYYNVCFQATRDAEGRIDGILNFAYDVTAEVRARQQLQQLNEELESHVQQRTAQLARQQRQLQQILGQVPAFIATLEGPEHRHNYFNAGYYAWSGNRAHRGLTVAEVYPETVPQGFITLLDEVYRTGQPFVGTDMLAELFDLTTGKSEPRYVDFIYQPLTNEVNQTQGILAFIIDVTEKVRARQEAAALQAELLATAQTQAQTRETFYEVFEQTPALIQLLRAPGHHIEYVNPSYQRLFAGRQLVGLDLADALPELREQGFIALMDHVYQTGETYFATDTPFEVAAGDGQPARTAYFSFTYQTYKESGQVAGITVFAYEVTEQVLARQERDAQQQQLSQLFMQAPAAISILSGPQLVYELINPIYQGLFPGRDLAGRPIAEALPELAGTRVLETFRQVYQTGVTHEEKSLLIPLLDPVTGRLEDRYFTYIQQARFDESGQIDGIIVFAFEITEQVHAGQQVEQLNLELTSTNQELIRTNIDLDNFIYTASHDLKAPITNIEGLLQALREHLPSETYLVQPVPQLLTLMQGAVERFQLTISQLADITKLQQAHSASAEPVDLASLFEAVRLDLPSQLTDGAVLQVDVTACPSVMFAPKNLRSILYNLLSNALKYRAPNRPPVVQLRSFRSADGRQAVLEVQDNGLGLDESQQAKLFGMFQRLHTHVEGSGIGLYMVKKIVENAGGTITVHSQPGIGSTFTASFAG